MTKLETHMAHRCTDIYEMYRERSIFYHKDSEWSKTVLLNKRTRTLMDEIQANQYIPEEQLD